MLVTGLFKELEDELERDIKESEEFTRKYKENGTHRFLDFLLILMVILLVIWGSKNFYDWFTDPDTPPITVIFSSDEDKSNLTKKQIIIIESIFYKVKFIEDKMDRIDDKLDRIDKRSRDNEERINNIIDNHPKRGSNYE